MSWANQKQELNNRKEHLDNFDTNAIRSLSQQINSAIQQYVNTAGISSNPNENAYYVDANNKFQLLVDKQKEYLQLIHDLNKKVKELAESTDINSKLQEIGTLQSDIAKLQKELDAVKQDADTSRARKAVVENPTIDLSWYQGFGAKIGFTKPLHKISISILVCFGLLLLFMSGLLLKEFFGSWMAPAASTQIYDSGEVFSLFSDSRFYAVLGGIAFASSIVGVLAYAGYLGKVL